MGGALRSHGAGLDVFVPQLAGVPNAGGQVGTGLGYFFERHDDGVDWLHDDFMAHDGFGCRCAQQEPSAGGENSMKSFWEEVRIISPVTWTIATLLAVTLFSCLVFVWIPRDPKLSQWPGVGVLVFSLSMSALVFAAVLLYGYVYADARRRGMRYVPWTFIAVLLPNMLGV